MIKFEYVEWFNFLSTGSDGVRFDLTDSPTTLIRGGNGAGKTTFLDAILYSLFGKPLRPIKLNQLVNSINKKKLLTKCNFTVNGTNYEVHRGQKPTVFEIYKDGEQIDALASAKELQDKLEDDILGTNYKTFTQVITVASTGHKRFMELTPSERRVVVEQMLDIEVISDMSNNLKGRYKEVRNKSALIDGKLNRITQSIDAQKRLIDSVGSVSDDQIESINKQMTELKVKDNQFKETLLDLRKQHGAKLSSMPDVDLDAIQTKQAEINSTIGDLNTKAHVAGNDSSQAKNLAIFYNNNDHCDRCNQHIDSEFKDLTISKLRDQHNTGESLVVDYNKQIADLRVDLKSAQDDMNLMSEWNRECNQILNQASQVQHNIKSNQDAVRRLMEQKQKLVDKGAEDTQSYYDEMERLNVEHKDIIGIRAEISEELELCDLCTEMLKDKGLKAKIIKQYLPVINQSINDLLDVMNAHYSFVLDEQFNETIKSRYRDNFSYGNFSNGEKQRIDSAILFMWRKLAESKNTVSSNLLILDEVLDGSLDKEGIDNLFGIFDTMPKSNIFIISHRPEIVERFEDIIDVNKVGNFSRYNFGDN